MHMPTPTKAVENAIFTRNPRLSLFLSFLRVGVGVQEAGLEQLSQVGVEKRRDDLLQPLASGWCRRVDSVNLSCFDQECFFVRDDVKSFV